MYEYAQEAQQDYVNTMASGVFLGYFVILSCSNIGVRYVIMLPQQ